MAPASVARVVVRESVAVEHATSVERDVGRVPDPDGRLHGLHGRLDAVLQQSAFRGVDRDGLRSIAQIETGICVPSVGEVQRVLRVVRVELVDSCPDLSRLIGSARRVGDEVHDVHHVVGAGVGDGGRVLERVVDDGESRLRSVDLHDDVAQFARHREGQCRAGHRDGRSGIVLLGVDLPRGDRLIRRHCEDGRRIVRREPCDSHPVVESVRVLRDEHVRTVRLEREAIGPGISRGVAIRVHGCSRLSGGGRWGRDQGADQNGSDQCRSDRPG